MDKAAASSTGEDVAGTSKAVVLASSIPSTALSNSSSNAGDELPYPPEKYPGKLCALCNLGERSQLGQGNMIKILVNDEPMDVPERMQVDGGPGNPLETPNSSFEDSDSAVVLSHKRQKNGNKFKSLSVTAEYVDELEKIGHQEAGLPFKSLFDEHNHFYVHRSCANWSCDVTRNPDGSFTGLQTAIAHSLGRKCSFCNRYGASVTCKMTCANAFHFPCMTASGGFQKVQTFTSFCRDHINEVPNACPNAEDIKCRTCHYAGEIANLTMCCKCGDHYHGTCIGLAQAPGVRAGWQCSRCRQCHICRSDTMTTSTDTRTVACEHCDKIYHTQCVRPVMVTVPKIGWKCRCCRVCVDCGARSPGAGASSRWHQHYTVCDSCYQQRNKGFSCPVCHRAYRAIAQREMVKCSLCQKHVHSTCDPDADLVAYQAKKEASADYEYVCAPCKVQVQTGRYVPSVMRRMNSIDEDGLSLQESLYADQGEEGSTDKLLLKLKTDYGLGKGKPLLASKSAKKKFGLSLSRTKGGKVGVQKRSRLVDLGRKRGPKGKMRGIFGVPGLGLQRPTSDKESSKKDIDEEPGVENRLVLCSAKDKFVLTQDICVMCGAVGTDQEGCLISCSQCGQCYHPYCVTVKVTKVILQKGWRCLDCTVCEGCGQRHDEARLLLCDDCDVSYHIYCMNPPLDIVPQGNWKCRWCAICQKCGTNDPGTNCSWMNSYTECGPCASQVHCSVCLEGYVEAELIMQCTHCDRWLHGACDAVTTEEDAEKCFDEGYTCIQCRPRDVLPPHLKPKPKAIEAPPITTARALVKKSPEDEDQDCIAISLSFGLEGQHYVDGVCLSQHGLQQIKALQLDSVRKKRRPKVNEPVEKDAAILAAIECVVAGGSLDNSLEDIKMEPMDPKDEAEIYKDGMVWDRENCGPPEGYTLVTTEQGTVVLRKKRQRNLQKVGIGGFTVRNRMMKSLKETLVKDDELVEVGEVPQIMAGLEDKKKKTAANKKKIKNKLIETYPSYLQEAFFGKELLVAKPKLEMDLSDEEDGKKAALDSSGEANTVPGNKLSAEEVKMIESIRAKQQQIEDQKQKKFAMLNQQQQQQQQGQQPGVNKSSTPISMGPNGGQLPLQQPHPSTGGVPVQVNARPGFLMKPNQPQLLNQPPMMQPQQQQQPMTTDLVDAGSSGQSRMTVGAVTGGSSVGMPQQAVIKTEVLPTTGMDANFTDILDTIINDNDNDLLDGMDDIINGVFTDESQESQESLSMQSNASFQSPQVPKAIANIPQGLQPTANVPQHQLVGQPGPGGVPMQQTGMAGMGQQRMMVGPPQQQQQPGLVQQPQQMHMGQFDPQQQQRPGMMGAIPQQQQQIGRPIGPGVMTPGGAQLQQQQQMVSMPQTPTMGYPNSQSYFKYHGYNTNSSTGQVACERPDFNSGMPDQMSQQGQWNPMGNPMTPAMDQDMSGMGAGDDQMAQSTGPVTNNQKASERMRLDEMLNEMATSAPVLYANTHHPELKSEFPNWSDRHKQIIKRWRGLSVEVKTPFNQKARENRTTLRMKKTQQIAAQSSSASPKDGGASPSPSSSSSSVVGGGPAAANPAMSRQMSHVQLQQVCGQPQMTMNVPQSPQQLPLNTNNNMPLASPVHMQSVTTNAFIPNNTTGNLQMQTPPLADPSSTPTPSSSSHPIMIVSNSGNNNNTPQQQLMSGQGQMQQQQGQGNFMFDPQQQQQQQSLNEMMIGGVGGGQPQQMHMQQSPQSQLQQQQQQFHPSQQNKPVEVHVQVKNASDHRRLSPPLTFHSTTTNDNAHPSNTGTPPTTTSLPLVERESRGSAALTSPSRINTHNININHPSNNHNIGDTSSSANNHLRSSVQTVLSNHHQSMMTTTVHDPHPHNYHRSEVLDNSNAINPSNKDVEGAGGSSSSPGRASSVRTPNSNSSSSCTTEHSEGSFSCFGKSNSKSAENHGSTTDQSAVESTRKGSEIRVGESSNLNIVVSQPISQFMKAITVGQGPRQANPTSSQFVIHQPGPHYHPLLHSGPAPNVTVNPNGNFQTNPNATIRATYTPFRTFSNPFQALNNFGRFAGPIQAQLPQGVQSPILAAQLQTINQIASAQMQGQATTTPLLHIQSGNGSGNLEQIRKNVMPIFVSTTLSSGQRATTSKEVQAQVAKTMSTPETATVKCSSTDGHLSPMSNCTISPTSACSSPALAKTLCGTESSTPSPQSSTSSIAHALTPQPDQNIRVLTPSEIMRTLPSIPNQDAVCLSNADRSGDEFSGDQIDGAPARAHGFNYHQIHAESALTNPAMDQEKMTAQQKSLRDQENERQWKMLQAARAKEQQMQQQMVVQGGGMIDPNLQSPHDPSIMGLQSPTGFLPPTNKPRPGNFPQQGMIRPMSVQIPRQRMGQNPFSPQSQSSQSPMEQYPSSPAQSMMDMVTHSPSEQAHESLTQSPHTPRSFDMQSPNSGMSRSPAYSGGNNAQTMQQQQQPGANPYAMPPGTPRPGQGTAQVRPTVYARDMFGGQFSFPQDQYNSNNGNNNQQGGQQQQPQNPNMPQQQPHDGNRQLRDLLQRQQHSAPNSPSIGNTPQSPSNWNNPMDSQQQGMDNQQQSPMMMQGVGGGMVVGSDNNTFRLPLPPGAGARPQRMQMINQNMMRGPNPMVNNAPRPVVGQVEIRQRMVRPKNMQNAMQPQQYGQQQQQPNMMHPNQFNTLRMQNGMLVNNTPVGQNPGMLQQQVQHGRPQGVGQEQLMGATATTTPGQDPSQATTTSEQQEVAMIAESLQHNIGGPSGTATVPNTNASAGGGPAGDVESAEIPDNVTADLETLEQEVCGEDLFDEAFLGDLGDFNLLEYADPELNEEDKSDLLDSLELDEPAESGGAEKGEEKGKKETDLNSYIGGGVAAAGSAESAAGGSLPSNTMAVGQMVNPGINQPQMVDPNMNVNKDGQQQGQDQQHFQNPPNMVPQQQQAPQPQQQQQLQQRVYQMKQPMQLPPNIQQIQQHMISQIQQNAAMGKIVPPGTQFSSNGVIGTVTANNQIQFTYSGVIRTQNPNQPRMQHMRMVNPNGQQMMMGGQPRMMMGQVNRMPVPQGQDPNVQQQQQAPQQQGQMQQGGLQQSGQPPPPPYPVPPPPYPGNSGPGSTPNQEQPLLLEDLLEQEKREQERQQMGGVGVQGGVDPNQQPNMDQSFQRQHSMDGFQGNQQPQMGQLPMPQSQQQQPQPVLPGQLMGQPRPQMMPQQRGSNQTQWRMPTPQPGPPITEPRREIPVFPLQPAPPVPPENLVTDKDRQMHNTYDQWLSQQNAVLGDQLKYFETEVGKLRKAKKFLNTKQRQAKKTGGELNETDAAELLKVSNEQSIIQKQLESARKQARQHNILLQDYRAKRNIQNPASSPANVAPPSPLMSPSPMMQHSVQSPLNNPMIQAAQSPLHSPSPMMSQSPGPASINSIMQSPSNQAMSPYNTMQSSPRIGTPHNMEENPFSPSGVGPSPSPSLSARLTSPSPRMTSPQHRPQFAGNRVLSSPGGMQFHQQQQQQQGPNGNQQMIINLGNGQNQARFARPQMVQTQDGIRQRIVINTGQQQQQQQQQMFIGSPVNQNPNQQHMSQQQHEQMLLQSPQGQQQQQMNPQQQMQLGPQRALIQQRQQILQHQILNQSPMGQQGPPQQQYQKQSPIQSPIHQPQSPMINQMAPVSPMHSVQSPVQYQNVQGNQMIRVNPGQGPPQQQTQQQQQQQHQMNMMDSNQRNIYLQQQQMQNQIHNQEQQQQQQVVDPNQQQQQNMNTGGGGGIVGPHNPIPLPPSFFKHGYIKLGLMGGAPMFPFQRGAKRMPNPSPGQSTGPPQTNNTNKVTIVKRVVNRLPSSGKSADLSGGGDMGKMTGGSSSAMAVAKGKGEIVVIDSSPDDKQRIMDYDDDNDKAVVQEVSLSAAAPPLDDGSVIETFSAGDECVASPLEVTEEFVWFGSEYLDCDDDMKGLKSAMKPTTEKESSVSVSGESVASSSEYMSMGQDFIIETSSEGKEVDLAEIESGVNEVKDNSTPVVLDSVAEMPFEAVEAVLPVTSTIVGSSAAGPSSSASVAVNAKEAPKVSYAVRVPMTSTSVTTRPQAGVVTHNKLVKDVTQTTAIVSIGNTTISVPLLKSVPMSHSKGMDQQSSSSNANQSKKIVMKTPINLSKFNLKNKLNTLVSLSPVTISNATGKRVVQASIIRASTPQSPHTITISSPSTSSNSSMDSNFATANIMEKLSTKIKAHSLSYSKVSSLTVSQNALPEKIFQDDVSPDSSVEHEDTDLLSASSTPVSEKAEFNGEGSSTPTGIEEVSKPKTDGTPGGGQDEEKKSTIPFHVIVKKDAVTTTSSSTGGTLSVPQGTTQRLLSVMPQLSPLSQPSEMNTNMQNASQQLRTIMSSLNTSSAQQQIKVQDQPSSTAIIQKILSSEASTPDTNTTVVVQKSVPITTQSFTTATKMQKPTNVQLINKGTTINKNIDASKLTQILNAQSSGSSSPTGSILVVKQVRTGQRTTISTVKQQIVRTIKTDGESTQSGVPNLTKIQQNLQKEGNKAVIQFNSIQPPGLVISSSRPAIIAPVNSVTSAGTIAGSAVTIVASDGSAGIVKTTSAPGPTPPPPFTGSILSATLSKPSPKVTLANAAATGQSAKPSNALLHSQLTSPPFRRSKSTDEPPLFLRESPAPIHGNKRLSLELSNVKTEPVDGTEMDNGMVSSSTNSGAGCEISVSTSGCKSSTVTSTVPKSEDSQHVLLKQLLQNSSSPSNSTASPSIGSRSVPGLRAPSLGLVSSLEQQLSRPAIPPAPASQLLNCSPPTTSTTSVSSSGGSVTVVTTTTAAAASTGGTAPMDTATAKAQPMISKETSFISKPVVVSQAVTPTNVVPKSEPLTENQVLMDIEKIPASVIPTVPMAQPPVQTPAVTIPQPQNPVKPHPTEPPPPYHLAAMNTVPPPNVVIKKEMSSLPPEILQSAQMQPKVQLQKLMTTPSMQMPMQQPSYSHPNHQQQQQQHHPGLQQQLSHPQTPQPPQSPQLQTPSPHFNQMLISPPITNTIQNPLMSPLISQNSQNSNDIKKELIDDSSQQSAASDVSKSESSKNDFMDTSTESCMDAAGMKAQMESAADIKKRKRREYQKNRRQMQQNPKETNYGNKKKQKRLPKFEEDYDTFIDSMVVQLRQLPPMPIVEPELCRNYGICNPFGAGDLSKLNSVKDYGLAMGDLSGTYGCAELETDCDFYNTMPFGEKTAVKAVPAKNSTHYGFYDQEFSQLFFDVEDELKSSRFELPSGRERDIGTPDTVISSSSPECVGFEPIPYEFPGLKAIDEWEEEEEMASVAAKRAISPVVPIIVPVPIRFKGLEQNDQSKSLAIVDSNKENEFGMEKRVDRSKFSTPTNEGDNLTVTLTLSSSAAEDIIGVLRDLANILHMPAPTQYDIVERTTTPPSHRLGLYRAKGRDGKVSATVDIQTILNGSAKFCSHCDIVILNSVIRAKSNEFPGLDEQIKAEEDPFKQGQLQELYFCSRQCYKQFQWKPPGVQSDEDRVLKDVAGDESDGQLSTGSIRKSIDYELMMTDDDLKMEVDLDESELKEVAGGLDLKDLVEIKPQLADDEIEDEMEAFTVARPEPKQSRKCEIDSDVEMEPAKKHHKGLRYKFFSPNCFNVSPSKYRKPSDKEITETLFRMSITVTAGPRIPEDTRKCIFCHQTGDSVADGPSRLLNFDVDKWVHLNCALWSEGVYETVNGALMNLEAALQSSLTQTCINCNEMGATIKCFKPRCTNLYHLSCAMKDQCVFYKNKTTFCSSHAPKTEKDNELTTLSVQRRVYVDRDESRQVASVMHHSELSNLLRVGSLIFLNVGQLLPHQLVAFHTPNYIYPIGYKIIRFYWSMREPNKRCRYICSIADIGGRPEFRVMVQEPNKEDFEMRDTSPRAVWQRILEPLAEMRRDNKIIQLFPKYVSGEDLFGLTEPAVVRILESLPGIETLPDYRFKYGRNPLLELPLAINPSGAARTEPKLKQNLGYKKPHTQRTGSSQRPVFVPTSTIAGEVACPYSKQFVHSKSSQYKKMKQEWRNNVFLARSKIQGLGLYAARDLEKHTMVIEYIGEVIRGELSEFREKQYEAKNRGIYMFRLDEDRVVDATLSGGLARYINHSCNPNCVTEIVEVDREFRIIIFAKRRINRGEELSYDYKFNIEDDANKISCMCGAPNCKKWMN